MYQSSNFPTKFFHATISLINELTTSPDLSTIRSHGNSPDSTTANYSESRSAVQNGSDPTDDDKFDTSLDERPKKLCDVSLLRTTHG